METKRIQYSGQFKNEIAEYSLTSGKFVKEITKDLGIPCHNLDCWCSTVNMEKWSSPAIAGRISHLSKEKPGD